MDPLSSLKDLAEFIKNAYADKKKAEAISSAIIQYVDSNVGISRAKANSLYGLIYEINAIINYHSHDKHFLVELETSTQIPQNPQNQPPMIIVRTPHYLAIRSMKLPDIAHAKTLLVNALSSIKSPLILDLRGCRGGSAQVLYFILCHFFDDGTYLYDRGGRSNTTKVIVGSIVQTMEPQYVIPKFKGKVNVLVDSSTYSAGEILAAVLQAQHRAKIYGPKTFGMTNLVSSITIGQFVAHIPYAITNICQLKSDKKKNIENVGVVPDYPPQSAEYIDLVFDKVSNIMLDNYSTPSTK